MWFPANFPSKSSRNGKLHEVAKQPNQIQSEWFLVGKKHGENLSSRISSWWSKGWRNPSEPMATSSAIHYEILTSTALHKTGLLSRLWFCRTSDVQGLSKSHMVPLPPTSCGPERGLKRCFQASALHRWPGRQCSRIVLRPSAATKLPARLEEQIVKIDLQPRNLRPNQEKLEISKEKIHLPNPSFTLHQSNIAGKSYGKSLICSSLQCCSFLNMSDGFSP